MFSLCTNTSKQVGGAFLSPPFLQCQGYWSLDERLRVSLLEIRAVWIAPLDPFAFHDIEAF